MGVQNNVRVYGPEEAAEFSNLRYLEF